MVWNKYRLFLFIHFKIGLVKVFSSISLSFIGVVLSQWSRYSFSALILVVLTLRCRSCVSLHAHAAPPKVEFKFLSILDPFEVVCAGAWAGFPALSLSWICSWNCWAPPWNWWAPPWKCGAEGRMGMLIWLATSLVQDGDSLFEVAALLISTLTPPLTPMRHFVE